MLSIQQGGIGLRNACCSCHRWRERIILSLPSGHAGPLKPPLLVVHCSRRWPRISSGSGVSSSGNESNLGGASRAVALPLAKGNLVALPPACVQHPLLEPPALQATGKLLFREV
jgi:hypothetical protein